jgi:pyrroloquinoline quinone biosynthesis protein E
MAGANNGLALHKPLGLLAELTHRCPLGCPYCSNPVQLERRSDELDTATWSRVFREAAALGVLQVHLSGGEPGARRDLVDIVAAAHAGPLYTNLITSGVGLSKETLAALAEAGLDHVQISIQDSEPVSADTIAGYKGAYARKNALAMEVVRLGLPLTINMVVHRANIERIDQMIEQALQLGASRIEIAHVQYYGWALENRAMLMPTRQQVEHAVATVEALRAKHQGRIVIDAVVPDYYARFPKPCVGGWGRRSLNVTPSGRRVTRPSRFPDWNSGRCATIRWRISGRRRRLSTHSAAPIGCRNPVQVVRGANRTSAAVAVRHSCWRETRAQPIPCATSRRTTP